MDRETRQCKNCTNEFIIESDDFGFYKKIGVPAPTFCPKCRRQRRLAWRNDLTFYNRQCDLCGRKIVSLYSPEKQLTVYCNKCWWSDEWDPKDYAQNIDFSRPFFEQFRELQNKVPLLSMVNDNGVGSINCEYTQNVTFAKNCYMGSMSWKNEDCMYYYHAAGPETREVVDSVAIFHYSQMLYDCVFMEHSYQCRHCYYSTGLTDCAFMYDCKGCTDCFMCVNLRQKQYCILNKQYTKEEYHKILEGYKLDTHSGTEHARKEFLDFLSTQPRRFANIRNSVDSTGDALFNCKNVKDTFEVRGCEDVRFFDRGNEVKDSYDLSTGGESLQCYEGLTADHDFQVLFTIFSFKNQYCSYVENCHSSKYLFGCSGVKHGQYMILNKQYTKEEFETLREQLINHMKKTGEWGEFFPAQLSHFGYNETMAAEYFPLTKENAEAKGYRWFDHIQRTTGKGTIELESLLDAISDTPDLIVNEVLTCPKCSRNYKFVPEEVRWHKKYSIPLPRQCFYCRNNDRLKFENPMQLWHRSCMCKKEEHGHPGNCQSEFKTSYSPDRPEVIYCESCYQKEVN